MKTTDEKNKIEEAAPIADVETPTVWEFLRNVDVFAWGQTFNHLRAIYNAEGNRGRDGCWFCTVASEKKFQDGDEPTGIIRRFLRAYSKDPKKRNVPTTPATRRLVAKGEAGGRFNMNARREMFEFILKIERETGRVFIPTEEKTAIHELWAEYENNF